MDEDNAPLQELIQELSSAKNIAEKAAIAAEFCLSGLPEEIAHIARACVLFHWFDQTVVEALLQMPLTIQPEIDQVYEQIRALPFVEALPWGLRFQDLTREGLLQRYTRTQPELLQQAANLGASAYEKRQDDKKIAAELLFCSITAGDQDASTQLLHSLQEWAYSRNDWHYLRNLLQVQEEAENFSFVHPLPVDEESWILRGLVSQSKGEQEQAITSYSEAVAINPQNALTLVHRGTVYAEQLQWKKALADYDRALQIAPDLALAHAGRGIVFMQEGHYASALKYFDAAIQQNTKDPFPYYTRGIISRILGNNQEALVAFNTVLRLDPYYADAYREKGTILNKQGKYQEALTAFNELLRLDPYYADAYTGKGTALSGLKQYEQASLAYEEAKLLESASYLAASSNNAWNSPPQEGETAYGNNPPSPYGNYQQSSQPNSDYQQPPQLYSNYQQSPLAPPPSINFPPTQHFGDYQAPPSGGYPPAPSAYGNAEIKPVMTQTKTNATAWRKWVTIIVVTVQWLRKLCRR